MVCRGMSFWDCSVMGVTTLLVGTWTVLRPWMLVVVDAAFAAVVSKENSLGKGERGREGIESTC
jgi:hypothetical protein